MIERLQLADDYSISRIIKGGWQLAGGHGEVNRTQAINDMFSFFDAGITTFDCADIYTGVEETIGDFLQQLKRERGGRVASQVQVHTKYVPDRAKLGSLGPSDVRTAIERSLRRLRVEALDLVQFHYWDLTIPGSVEVALHLDNLRKEGLIRYIGLTNFDTKHVRTIQSAGVDVLTHQVQYSVLDRRPEKSLQTYCLEHDQYLLCYGGLAGGLISERYSSSMPTAKDLASSRSLVKYQLIVDDLGGAETLHSMLKELANIGAEQGLSLSQVALNYILQKSRVGAVIVGARNARHVDSLTQLAATPLTSEQVQRIDGLKRELQGDIYELERCQPRHSKIMKYNLNKGE